MADCGVGSFYDYLFPEIREVRRMKSGEKYFSLEYKENVNEMVFQKHEFFISETALIKRLEFLRKNSERFFDFVSGTFHVDDFSIEVY